MLGHRAVSRRGALGLALALATTLGAREAAASPAVDGTRNLSMGNTGRGSTYGTNAVLLNPSNMAFAQTFAIEPMYQLAIQSRTSGVGIIIMDSLNNSRVSLGLGYLFMRGKPTIKFNDLSGNQRKLDLSLFGHEAMIAVSVTIVKRWLAVAVKPKYQYVSLRYRDDEGAARNAASKLNAFGLDVSLTANFAGWAALALTATNLTGNKAAPYTDERDVRISGIEREEGGEIDHGTLQEVSEYPLAFGWGASVFPLHHLDFSLNVDGFHDFTSYRFEKATRLVYGGSAEYVAGPVPIRFGAKWDSRGKGKKDDRIYVSGGLAYVRPPPVGSVGVDVGFGFQQQVSGDHKETIIGLNLGLRIHPDL
ncbi:MAG TPA: hypothetical protein VFG69_08805 [Nannocystaceae bacterium]|nr:hypothetical protein [Nannocystaceae bacterium]